MEETTKRRQKRSKKHHHADSPDGAKPSKFWKKITRPWRKLSKSILPSGKSSRKREDEQPRATPSVGKKVPRFVYLVPLLGAGLLLSVYLRGCNSTEVVIEENADTVKVRQMMNQFVQQQQQSEVNSGIAPPAASAPGASPTSTPPAVP